MGFIKFMAEKSKILPKRNISLLFAFIIPRRSDKIKPMFVKIFEKCWQRICVRFPDGVVNIGDYAFYGCSSLTSITIPDSVASIGNYAFCMCTSLTSVSIGNGVTSIGEWAFAYCLSLTSITIPDSVTSIGEEAFYWCDSLTDIYYTGSAEEWTEILIGENNSKLINATIHYDYVPED